MTKEQAIIKYEYFALNLPDDINLVLVHIGISMFYIFVEITHSS